MSEKHIPRLEHGEAHEKVVTNEHQKRAQELIAEHADRARQEKSAENLVKIQEMAKIEAQEAKKIVAEEQPDNETDSMLGMQHSLKSTAYKRTLANTRQKLSKPVRVFSRIAHSPMVDKISSVGAETVARPSGILGGSICAFLGSLTVYYFAKHYGFRYNYLLVFILFIGGYIIGALLELAVWFAYTRKQRY